MMDVSPGFATVITLWIYEDSWKTKILLTNTGNEPHCLVVLHIHIMFFKPL